MLGASRGIKGSGSEVSGVGWAKPPKEFGIFLLLLGPFFAAIFLPWLGTTGDRLVSDFPTDLPATLVLDDTAFDFLPALAADASLP